jgi:hypothetical protein
MTASGYTLDAGVLGDLTSGWRLNDDDIVISYGRASTEAGADGKVGTMSFALRNDDRVFSPENSSSTLYGKILPGVPIRMDKLHLGTSYPLFVGQLDDFDVDADSASNTFTATVRDTWGAPGAEILSTPVYRGIRTGEAIGYILDAIGWKGARELDPGATYIPFWWEDGTDAATAVKKLVDSEGPSAIAFVEGGIFKFHDRHHRTITTASTTSQATFALTIPGPSGPGILKIARGFKYDHGVKQLSNTVAFEVEQRKPAEVARVWQTEDTFSIGVNETLQIDVKGSSPFINAEVPVVNIDYTLMSGAVTPTLSRTSGQSAVLSLAAGGTGAVVAGMAVRASEIAVARTVKIGDSDAGSVAARGRQTWQGAAPWANIYDAQVIAQKVVALYASNRPSVTFEIVGYNDEHLTQALARKISDRITVRNDKFGINADFIIEAITHTIGNKLGVHRTQFLCSAVEPTQPANALRFDVAGAGFNDGRFAINGIDDAATTFRFDMAGRGFNDGKFSS